LQKFVRRKYWWRPVNLKGAAGAAYGGAKRLKMMGMGVRPLLFVLSPIVVVEINAELTFLLKN